MPLSDEQKQNFLSQTSTTMDNALDNVAGGEIVKSEIERAKKEIEEKISEIAGDILDEFADDTNNEKINDAIQNFGTDSPNLELAGQLVAEETQKQEGAGTDPTSSDSNQDAPRKQTEESKEESKEGQGGGNKETPNQKKEKKPKETPEDAGEELNTEEPPAGEPGQDIEEKLGEPKKTPEGETPEQKKSEGESGTKERQDAETPEDEEELDEEDKKKPVWGEKGWEQPSETEAAGGVMQPDQEQDRKPSTQAEEPSPEAQKKGEKSMADSVKIQQTQNQLRQEQQMYETKIKNLQNEIKEETNKIKSLKREIWMERIKGMTILAFYTVLIIILFLALLVLLVISIFIVTLPFTVPAMGFVSRQILSSFINFGRKMAKTYSEIRKKKKEIDFIEMGIRIPKYEIKEETKKFNQTRQALQKQAQQQTNK